MKIPRCRVIVVSIMLTHFSLWAQAQSPYGVVSGATGRAGVAANDHAEQVIMNPAAMAHSDRFSVGYFYRGGLTEEAERNQQLAITIMDNSPDVYFAGGFLYQQEKQSYLNQLDLESRRIQLSLSKFMIHQISFGLSAFHYEIDLEDGSNHDTLDFNFGLLWNPGPTFAMGFHAENLGSNPKDFPVFYAPKDRLTLGIHYIFMPQFRVRADLGQQTEQNPDKKWDLRMGMESYVDAFLVLRFGYEVAGLEDRDYLTAGFGFTGPRLRIDYVYRANTDYSGGALHGVDFRLPF